MFVRIVSEMRVFPQMFYICEGGKFEPYSDIGYLISNAEGYILG